MSTGTVWNYRDFIKREHGSEEAIEFEIAVRKYQAEQIAYERERIIKLLEGYALQKCDDLCAYQCECYGKFEAKGFIELIKGEQK